MECETLLYSIPLECIHSHLSFTFSDPEAFLRMKHLCCLLLKCDPSIAYSIFTALFRISIATGLPPLLAYLGELQETVLCNNISSDI